MTHYLMYAAPWYTDPELGAQEIADEFGLLADTIEGDDRADT